MLYIPIKNRGLGYHFLYLGKGWRVLSLKCIILMGLEVDRPPRGKWWT
jgi:hypothetical protein